MRHGTGGRAGSICADVRTAARETRETRKWPRSKRASSVAAAVQLNSHTDNAERDVTRRKMENNGNATCYGFREITVMILFVV